MILTFTETIAHHPRSCWIKSITVTAVAGTAANLEVYPYRVTDGSPVFVAASPAGSTTQVQFSDLDFSSGFTLVADEGVYAYVVEYADL